MPNYGTPFETTTPEIRAFRVNVGDKAYTTVAPPPGHPEWTADYAMFSDLDAESFLEQGGGSPLRAAGYVYLVWAGEAARESKSVKDYDLQVDLTKRAHDLRLSAAQFFEQADEADSDDGFFVVPMGDKPCACTPELAAPWICGWPGRCQRVC